MPFLACFLGIKLKTHYCLGASSSPFEGGRGMTALADKLPPVFTPPTVVGVLTDNQDSLTSQSCLTNFTLSYFLPGFVTFLLDEKSNQKNQEEKKLAERSDSLFFKEVHREP
jgi:hypothetical protein